MIEHVLVSLEENEDMCFVEKFINMDVVLLVALEMPLKFPRPSLLFQVAVLRGSSCSFTKYVRSMLSVMD